MVCGNNHLIVGLGKEFKEFAKHSMLKPREGNAAISRLVVGKFAHHLRLRSGV